jgi:uncharacterized protein YndB with AHSA1/START domain
MIINILIGLAVIIVLFVVVVSMRPADFKVTRSATIDAPPEVVFTQVNDLHNWEAWSPWAKLDPNAKNTYEGPPAGQGAAFAWDGNNNVGAGRMTITESRPGELVRFKLDFERPMKGTNIAEFIFKPSGNQTVVSWTMTGKYSFMGKAFDLVMNCEKMVGGQFDQGLAQMKTLAEAAVVK